MTQETDRELLELAAKAAGIEYESRYVNHAGEEHRGLLQPSGIANIPNKWWNPLTDDGDALRLAVTLRLNIYQGFDQAAAEVILDGDNLPSIYRVNHEGDDCAATRRAIVKAAAAIGKAME